MSLILSFRRSMLSCDSSVDQSGRFQSRKTFNFNGNTPCRVKGTVMDSSGAIYAIIEGDAFKTSKLFNLLHIIMNWVITHIVAQKFNPDGTSAWSVSTSYTIFEDAFILSNDESKLLLAVNAPQLSVIVIDTTDISNIKEYALYVAFLILKHQVSNI